MGGLRKKIPWTFWTMTAGTLAIAGIPGLAGFFSKDAILWRAYQASWAYWLVGVITALLTSFYMFRLWFMTFFGEYRGEADSQNDSGHAAHDAHGSHGHGGIHESPRVMVVPLVILAVLSVVGGYVGVPGSLGGNNRFDQFLGPVFHASAPAEAQQTAIGEKGTSEKTTAGSEPKTEASTELMFTGISVLAALLGLGLAWFLYYKRRDLPAKIATSLDGFYELVLHKYYVDELYAAVFVKPLIAGSTRILWQGVDRNIIDAAVNEAGEGASHISDEVRHMQSGNIRSYAGWIAAGSAVVIAVMVWLGAQQ